MPTQIPATALQLRSLVTDDQTVELFLETVEQVYIYGSLDRGPTELARNFGMAWGVGGWLLTPFLQKIGPEGMDRLRRRVAAGLTTTFASGYTNQVSLAGALAPDAIADYDRQATGSKYLILPSLSE